jgi:K+-transporting ATPase A subunit
VSVDGVNLGILVLSDILKPGIRERMQELQKMAVRTVMVTGDNPLTARTIAAEAGVEDFVAEIRNGGADLGNFYRDLVRFITRVLMPICFVVAFFMIAQGAVQTFDASIIAHTLQGGDQTMVVGPVASQGTIELIGTNDGGFYNANAAHPFQNPPADAG